MDKATFWKIVAEMGWAKPYKYDAIKKAFMVKYPVEVALEFAEVFKEVKDTLYNRLDPVITGVSDDSFSDLLCHIIGLGESEYNAVMANRDLAQDRVDRGDYRESFSYAIPYKDDYEMLHSGYYANSLTRMAKKLVEYDYNPPAELLLMIDGAKAVIEDPHKFKIAMNGIIEFVKAGDYGTYVNWPINVLHDYEIYHA